MKTKYLLLLVLFLLCFLPVNAQQGLPEGHPDWWWGSSKSADFIVEGVITYAPTKYYELNAINIEGKSNKYYWMVGKIKMQVKDA